MNYHVCTANYLIIAAFYIQYSFSADNSLSRTSSLDLYLGKSWDNMISNLSDWLMNASHGADHDLKLNNFGIKAHQSDYEI